MQVQLPSFEPQHISNALWALARLEYFPGGWNQAHSWPAASTWYTDRPVSRTAHCVILGGWGVILGWGHYHLEKKDASFGGYVIWKEEVPERREEKRCVMACSL